MSLDENAEHTIPKTYPLAFQKSDSFSYHIDIESKIDEILIAKIMQQAPGIVNIMERKGLNLYHPFINRILERHKLSSININRSSSYTVVKKNSLRLSTFYKLMFFLKVFGKKGYLLTDAVNEGKDVHEVDDALSMENATLSLVCGYVVKGKNLENLKKRYSQVPFIFVHEAQTDEEYWEKMTRLLQLSHTRMEPLDPDHCFHIYKFKRPLSKDQIIKIFTDFFKTTLNITCTFEKDDVRPFEDDIESFTSYIDNFEEIIKQLPLIDSPIFQINDLTFRLKYDGDRSLVRVMAFFAIDVDFEKLHNDEKFCMNLPQPCCPRKMRFKKVWQPRCIQCIENNISYALLNAIEVHFSNDIIIKGFQLGLVARYYPW